MTTCPACHEQLENDARVCRHCFHVLDAEGWQHDPGRLGADDRGGGRPLEDPPVGPLPVTDLGGGWGGWFGSALKLVPAGLLARSRKGERKA